MAVGLRGHLKNDADHVLRTLNRVTLQLQKRNKTANINVKNCGLYTSQRHITHRKLQKLQKGDITQQHIDI